MSGRYWMLVIALGGCLSGNFLDAKQASAEPEDLEWVEIRRPAIEEDTSTQSETEQRGTPQFPLQVEIIEDPEDAERSRRREADSYQREQDDLIEQRRSADAATRSAGSAERQEDLTLWQVILAAIGTIAFLYTLKLSRHANASAVKAAEAAERAVEVAQGTAKTELRAYLSLSPGPIKIGDAMYVKITQKNCGQTPAEWVQFFACAKILPINREAGPDFPEIDKEPGINAVQPTHSFSVSITVPETNTVRDASTGKRTKFPYRHRLVAGSKTDECVYVFTEVQYEDVFGRKHGTRACWRYEFSGSNLKEIESDWFDSEFIYTEKKQLHLQRTRDRTQQANPTTVAMGTTETQRWLSDRGASAPAIVPRPPLGIRRSTPVGAFAT